MDFHLEIYFDAETYLYHNTPQPLYLKFQNLKLFKKKKKMQLAMHFRGKSQISLIHQK